MAHARRKFFELYSKHQSQIAGEPWSITGRFTTSSARDRNWASMLRVAERCDKLRLSQSLRGCTAGSRSVLPK